MEPSESLIDPVLPEHDEQSRADFYVWQRVWSVGCHHVSQTQSASVSRVPSGDHNQRDIAEIGVNFLRRPHAYVKW